MTPAEPVEPAASTHLIEAALVIFLIVFLVIVARLVFTRSSRYRDAARIPLSDDEVVTPRDDASAEPQEPPSGDRT